MMMFFECEVVSWKWSWYVLVIYLSCVFHVPFCFDLVSESVAT